MTASKKIARRLLKTLLNNGMVISRGGIRFLAGGGRGLRQSKQKEIKNTNYMPVQLIKPNTFVNPGFQYPKTGKINLFLQSDRLVDVYLTPKGYTGKIKFHSVVPQPEILSIKKTSLIANQIISIPFQWSTQGWEIVIANLNIEPVACYYTVTIGH